MMHKKAFDVAVVGGGIMGLATLYHIASNTNLKVALFERSRIGSGSTHKSGGFVRTFHVQRRDIEWSVETLSFLRQYKEETNFNAVGCLYLADGIEKKAITNTISILQEVGESVELCSASAIAKKIPQLKQGIRHQVIYEPNAGFADPLKTSLLYAELAKQAGAVIFECAEVTHIDAGNPIVLHVNGDKVEAKQVSLNTGAWSPDFLGQLGLKSDVFKKSIQADNYLVDQHDFPSFCMLDHQSDIYTRPFGNGQQLIGMATKNLSPDLEKQSQPDVVQQQACLAKMGTLFNTPKVKPIAMGGRVGFDGYRKGYRGRVYHSEAMDNLCISEGWSGAGFKLAHGIGRTTMNLLLERI